MLITNNLNKTSDILEKVYIATDSRVFLQRVYFCKEACTVKGRRELLQTNVYLTVYTTDRYHCRQCILVHTAVYYYKQYIQSCTATVKHHCRQCILVHTAVYYYKQYIQPCTATDRHHCRQCILVHSCVLLQTVYTAVYCYRQVPLQTMYTSTQLCITTNSIYSCVLLQSSTTADNVY